MKKSYWMLPLVIISILFLAACSADTTETAVKPVASRTPDTRPSLWSAANQDALGNTASNFLIQFNGQYKWKYTLATRKSAGLTENNLHIEGLDKARNPGDIRSVTDTMTTWMIGEGTDKECVQFPNNQGMDTKWLTPETMVSPRELSANVKLVGEEKMAGRDSLHYAGSAAKVDVWKDARFELWLDKATQALLKLEFLASGDDEFFWTGSGTLYALYTVDNLTPGKIDPVPGCALSVPVPDNATRLVRLPGLASYNSKSALNDLKAFYLDRLPKEGWKEAAPVTQSATAIVLSYQRNAEKVEIHIEAATGGGSAVKLIFLPNS
jgi:hypothetical protein